MNQRPQLLRRAAAHAAAGRPAATAHPGEAAGNGFLGCAAVFVLPLRFVSSVPGGSMPRGPPVADPVSDANSTGSTSTRGTKTRVRTYLRRLVHQNTDV